jgi:protein TonB
MTALVPPFGSRAVTLSAALHGAAITALVLTSILGPERWPAVDVASARPVILDVASVVAATPPRPVVRPAHFSLPPRRPSGPQVRSSRALPAARVILEAEAPADPGAGAGANMTGGCTVGCMVAGGEAASGDPAAAGVDGGGPAVVSIVPGGVVRPPRKVRDLAPVYPELAMRSRVEGRVDIECRIDTGGRVMDATVTRGHPLLSGAALDAVRQWLYEPTLLNGVPVSVVMTVAVHFRLHR